MTCHHCGTAVGFIQRHGREYRHASPSRCIHALRTHLAMVEEQCATLENELRLVRSRTLADLIANDTATAGEVPHV